MEPVNMTEDELSKMKYADLQKLAKEAGVSAEGNKATIISRILNASERNDEIGSIEVADEAEVTSEDVCMDDEGVVDNTDDPEVDLVESTFEKKLEGTEVVPEYVTLSSPVIIFRGPSECFPVGSFGGMLHVTGKVQEFYCVDYVRAGLGLTHGYALQREVDSCRLSK